jgi:hypothetical protein
MEHTPEIRWDIRREGRKWRGGESIARFEAVPHRFEVVDGQLLWSDKERLIMLATMLEAVGLDWAVRLGDPQLWREAVATLDVDKG